MYICTTCDAQSPKWNGRCDVCGGWGTLQEQVPTKANTKVSFHAAPKSAPLLDVAKQGKRERIKSQISELDRVLGGGMVVGSLLLFAGEPGVGKSTLVAKLAGNVNKNVLYVSGEESAAQLSERFGRLGSNLDKVNFLEPYPVESIIAAIEKEKPPLAIIDSVQTLTSSQMDATAGSPNMVRYATNSLLDLSKRSGTTIVLIGQVTKDGSVAGPKTLEHLVDVVVNIEGDPINAYRIVRSSKNRFGSTDEVGIFEMTSEGLVPVENPSQKFLEERTNVPGSVITAIVEGSRVFLVEVQALVEKTSYGTPIRRASGFDQNRLQMLGAIMSKRGGLALSDQDIYLNVIGGMNLKEPAADLAVCAALKSAFENKALVEPSCFFGEVGLGGEVRSVPHLKKRLEEAKRLGINKIVDPSSVKTIKEL